MKKITSIFLALFMVFTLATSVLANSENAAVSPAVTVNGEQIEFTDNTPIIQNGVTLVPARALFETLGYEVSWFPEDKVVFASQRTIQVALAVGENTFYINNFVYELKAPVQFINNTVYIPLRDVSEALGYYLAYNTKIQSIALLREAGEGYAWKVEKDGNEVYILGSIHTGEAGFFPLRDEIEQAYEASDYLVVEVDITKLPTEKQQAEITKYSVLEEGKTIKDLLSEETYANLIAFYELAGIDPAALETSQPWVISNLLMTIYSEIAGYQAGLGIDLYYISTAQADEKEILELEDYVIQYRTFSEIATLEEQVANLEIQLNEIINLLNGQAAAAQDDNAFDLLVHLWKGGSESNLNEFMEGYEEGSPGEYKAIITDRHENMMEKIEEYLADEEKNTYFIVVGYSHVLGKEGLITQLREKGYTVTKL